MSRLRRFSVAPLTLRAGLRRKEAVIGWSANYGFLYKMAGKAGKVDGRGWRVGGRAAAGQAKRLVVEPKGLMIEQL